MLRQALADFVRDQKFKTKGPLCVALVVTQHARKRGLPLAADELLTSGGGQVYGLGKGAVQAVLNEHGIDRVLAAEGGRTSRGSIQNMRAYVGLLNDLHEEDFFDLDTIESFWIERVREFFSAKPFTVGLDASLGIRALFRSVFRQAKERQKQTPGVHYVGAVMQHLVGAKLEIGLGEGAFKHNSFSTADAQKGRAGDFVVGDVAIHVTTAPGETVIDRCRQNLVEGLKPILITTQRGLGVAEGLAENKDLGKRVDVVEIEQFLATGVYERGGFTDEGRRDALRDLVDRYNTIVERVETDHSMKLQFTGR